MKSLNNSREKNYEVEKETEYTINFIKKEFSQNYLQYRWIDETRTKFINRFFIMVFAFIIWRFEFGEKLTTEDNVIILLFIYIIFNSVIIFFSRAIIQFRRQQRGHSEYINSIRAILSKILNERQDLIETCKIDNELMRNYIEYIDGKRIYLTKWIELATGIVVLISPSFAIYDIVRLNLYLKENLTRNYVILFILLVIIIWLFIFKPWFVYNYKKKLDWKKD